MTRTLVALGLFVACAVEQPRVEDEGYEQPKFAHAGFADRACGSCHEVQRPKAPHPESGDCGGCHTSRDDRGGWLPTTIGGTGTGTGGTGSTFTHEPPPASCNGCHEKDRPAPPHVAGGDCVSCHKFPKWK